MIASTTLAFALTMSTGPAAANAARPSGLWVADAGSDTVLRCDFATGDCEPLFPPGTAGVSGPHHFSFGPSGDVYVASWGTGSVERFDGRTLEFREVFVQPGAGGLSHTQAAVWGQDGHLYCPDELGDNIVRFDGRTGAFLDVFIEAGSGGLDGPEFLRYGPDGHLYVSDKEGDSIRRYDARTGAFLDVFIDGLAGGVRWGNFFTWGPDKHLYLSSSMTYEVLRFDGETGQFIDVFIPAGHGGLSFPTGLTFSADGSELYVASLNNSRILRYNAATGAVLGALFLQGIVEPQHIALVPTTELQIVLAEPELGKPCEVRAFGAAPGERVSFVVGPNAGCSPLPFCDVATVLVGPPARRIAPAVADARGQARTRVFFGAGLAGRAVLVQAVAAETCRVSSVFRAEFR